MNNYDAAKFPSISGEITPDINPTGTEMMKVVNAADDLLRDHSGKIKDEQAEYGEMFNTALNTILPLHGLIIEVCGVWIWVTCACFPLRWFRIEHSQIALFKTLTVCKHLMRRASFLG